MDRRTFMAITGGALIEPMIQSNQGIRELRANSRVAGERRR